MTIWYYNITHLGEADYNIGMLSLPKNQTALIKTTKNMTRKKQQLISMLLLRKAILKTTQSLKLLNNLKRTTNNKPFIPKWLNFSISYSGDYVVFAFSDNNFLGIDIEKQEKVFPLQLRNDYFSKEEQRTIQFSTKHKESLCYELWTKKEAFLKATGMGITKNTTTISIINAGLSYDSTSFFFAKIDLAKNYVCYLATDIKKNIKTIREIKAII